MGFSRSTASVRRFRSAKIRLIIIFNFSYSGLPIQCNPVLRLLRTEVASSFDTFERRISQRDILPVDKNAVLSVKNDNSSGSFNQWQEHITYTQLMTTIISSSSTTTTTTTTTTARCPQCCCSSLGALGVSSRSLEFYFVLGRCFLLSAIRRHSGANSQPVNRSLFHDIGRVRTALFLLNGSKFSGGRRTEQIEWFLVLKSGDMSRS